MPCAYYRIKISSRLKCAPTTAQAAYISGERIKDELTNRTKNYTSKGGIVYTEIMLPDNAPIEYADRSTLWNSVEKVENKGNAQNARKLEIALPRELPMEANIRMVREYCLDEFVSKGMIADIAIHDPEPKGNNPHVHIMLTMRAMDENGKWLPKSHREYVLDSDGNRVRNEKGEWATVKVETVDWNHRDNAEKWRHAWELIQNEYLAEYGSPERISMKSYKRQGIDRIPMVHMSPAVAAMERQGIQTDIGDLNREIRKTNELIEQIKKAIEQIRKWIKELMDMIREREREAEIIPLADVLDKAFMDLAKEYEDIHGSLVFFPRFTDIDGPSLKKAITYLRENEINTVYELKQHLDEVNDQARPLFGQVGDMDLELRRASALLKAGKQRKELDPIQSRYSRTFFKKAKQEYGWDHERELREWKEADEYIRKYHHDEPLDLDELSETVSSLTEKLEKLQDDLKPVNYELDCLEAALHGAHVLIPDIKTDEKGREVYYSRSLWNKLKEDRERMEKERKEMEQYRKKERNAEDLEI